MGDRALGQAPVSQTILQVIQQGQLRGAELFALDLSAELAREGSWEASVVSLLRLDASYAAAAATAGIKVIAAQPNGRAHGFDPRLAWKLREVIDGGPYPIVQANGAGTLKYLVAARWLSRRRWWLVYRAIGMGSFWRRGLGRRLSYSWLLAQPDLVVAVCRAVADDLLATTLVDPRKILVVPNGVKRSRLGIHPGQRESTRALLGVTPDEHLLIYVGSLTREKNVHTIITTIAKIRLEGLPVKAVFIGDGPLRTSLQDAVRRHGLETAIQLLPSQTSVGKYLASADLFVLPSLSEGMPAAIIEAGLNGVPTVAYSVGGVPEVIVHGTTGLLVRPGDETGFAQAVATLLVDSSRRAAMGEAARSRYRKFEIEVVADGYREAYEMLLQPSGAR